MALYLSPGVYVEEVPSAVRPIAGVGTSTAGFIGLVADDVGMPPQPGQFMLDKDGKVGKFKVKDNKFELDDNGQPKPDQNGIPYPLSFPLATQGEPQLITNWQEFKNKFGDVQAGNRVLAHAVYGFFNNGGTRCWVIRLKQQAQANATKQSPKNSTSKDTQMSTEEPTSESSAQPQSNPTNASATDEVKNALAGFEAIDEIAIVAVPGALDADIQGAVLEHCEKMQDRFAILDGQQNPTPVTSGKINGSKRTSNYAALYYPWIDVGEKDENNKIIYLPPSGHIAGVYARVDAARGVHKAPANEVIRGALGVEKLLSREHQDGLNPEGINVIRAFNGNITVWGARTLGGDANNEWKYVNVRRLFLFLRESIDEGTQWVVFEPNEPGLWAKITRNVTAFLTNVWEAGALFGDTPQQAFYVKCDEETNPPEVRDLGQVVTEVGVAVVKPAEFVIFRISQWAGAGQS